MIAKNENRPHLALGDGGRAATGRNATVTHAEDILRRIEEDILLGRLVPGAKLDERALAEQFGVSRTPVREAIHKLSARGLVVLRGRQGAQIAELPVSDLLDAFFVVAELEGMAAKLAARRIRPAEREVLLAHHQRCADCSGAGDEEGFVRANADFHGIIITASQNRALQEQLRNARLLIAPYRYLSTFRPGRMSSSIPEHQKVMDAILCGDGNTAAEMMSQHVNLLGDSLSDLLHFLEDHVGSMRGGL